MLRRESAFGLFHFPTQLLHGAVVFADVHTFLLLVQLNKVVHDALQEKGVNKGSISVGGKIMMGTSRNQVGKGGGEGKVIQVR